MISETIVGLKTYEVRISDKKMDTYIKWTESHEDPMLNIWQFIISMTLLMMNQYGKKLKNDYGEEYAVRKIVESFFQMEIHKTEDPRDLDEYMYNLLLEAD